MSTTTQQIIADNIRKIIKRRGFIQRGVAERAGFSEQQFCDMLVGRKVIRAEYMPDIARALEAEIEDIFSIGQDST